MIRRYQDALFTALPIFLVQSAGEIYQVVGDYGADSIANISTFAVRYGKKASLRAATGLLLTTISLPILYELLNLSLNPYLVWYLIALTCLVPCYCISSSGHKMHLKKNFAKVRAISRRVGAVILLAIFLCVLVVSMIVVAT